MMEIFWTMLASQDRKRIREYIAEQNLIGVSLDIENYCTLRLLFNQSLVLDKVPEYGKPAKYCSP
ncbi:type II toxin-antitoxin system RelE/ParE family toxin [Salmonella enterica]|nr:type II toxin-antitoxin system RelE/ParE family toxin [Salmonella enterica]